MEPQYSIHDLKATCWPKTLWNVADVHSTLPTEQWVSEDWDANQESFSFFHEVQDTSQKCGHDNICFTKGKTWGQEANTELDRTKKESWKIKQCLDGL